MGGCGQKWAWDYNFNEWMNLAEFSHANTFLRKLKVTLIVIRWAWSNMGVSFFFFHRTLKSAITSTQNKSMN